MKKANMKYTVRALTLQDLSHWTTQQLTYWTTHITDGPHTSTDSDACDAATTLALENLQLLKTSV